MNITSMKWVSALLSTVVIGVFEFVRHHFLHVISMDWGNLLVAVLAGVLFVFYFHGIFAFMEKLYNKLQKEKEETAVLQERDRIARELHDSVSQALFFMNIKVAEIETALQQRQETLKAVAELKEAIQLTDADIRKHIFALRQVTPKDINLTAAIEEYVKNYEKQDKLKIGLKIQGDINSKLTKRVKKRLLRISQELLVNIRKHAAANQVDVILFEDGRRFSMIIRDNGKGFCPECLSTKTTSFGYENMENDIRDMGAKLDVQSCPGKGTTVTIRLELKEEEIF